MKQVLENITTVEELTPDDFHRNFFEPNKPVIIKGGAKNSEAFKKWSEDYLKSLIGKKLVDVRYSKNGVFNYHKSEVSMLNLPFEEAVNFMKVNNSVYIQQASVYDKYPELAADVPDPQWMEKTDIQKVTNFWFGGAGCISPLHYDGLHNFLIQIMGRKELTLFSPEDSKYLYPNIYGEPNLRQISLVEMSNPDLNLYPLYENAQPYSIILNPGDILYIPLKWWHQVKSLDLSISINYWWHRFELVDGLGFESESSENLKTMIKMFLDSGLKIDYKNIEGETNLLKACDKGYVNIAKALLELGADPKIESNKYKGLNAVSLAKDRGHSEILKLFSEAGVN